MEFRLPEIGEGLYEAEVSRWLVKPGDAVRPGQGLLEVLTDKATMEVPAPFTGTIQELRAEAGNTIKVGEVVLSYQGRGAAAPATEVPPTADETAPPATPPRNNSAATKASRASNA